MRKSPVISFVVAGVALIVVLIPFHAFLTVWGSVLLGHYTLLRLWKEFLIVPLGLAAIWLAWRDRALRHQMLGSWLFRLIAAYVVLFVLLGLVALKRHTVSRSALYEGLIIDLRLVAIFYIAWVGASISPWLKAHWRQLLLMPAAVVVIFGLLQVSVLPADFLAHFGYRVATIMPFETIDQNMQFVRVQSTLRGSDPLGAYLVLVIAAIASLAAPLLLRRRLSIKEKLRITWPWAVSGLVAVIVLYFTYSRSAYVGTLLVLAGAVYLSIPSKAVRTWLLVGGVACCVVFGGVAFALRHNPTFEDTFFHTSQLSTAQHRSNQNHTTALKNGIRDVVHEPFGRGPGTAGPASAHNIQPARIAENFYLQIGQEAGWLGLGLFLIINILIAKAFWDRRAEQDQLALVLLVSLVGLTVINLLLHAWADDTLAYVWWGLAGVAYASTVTSNTPEKRKKG